MSTHRRILVTGGMGFIGAALVRRLLNAHADVEVLNLDALTYAGNPANLSTLRDELGAEAAARYRFVRGDIRDARLVQELVSGCWGLVHLAAESHVDRSLLDGSEFISTNVLGTYTVLAAARAAGVSRVLVQSTDEVYGPTTEGVDVDEKAPYGPRSPYSASKAGAEMQAQAFFNSFDLPVVIARPMNTIGPRQYPEKAIPLFTINALLDEPLPLYGDGSQERNRFYVEDHAEALDVLLHHGVAGEAYNAGAPANYATNRDIAERICDLLERPHDLIRPVADRPGHDTRYRLDVSKLMGLGWQPRTSLDEAMERTVLWYRDHPRWWRPLYDQMQRSWYQRQYGKRLI